MSRAVMLVAAALLLLGTSIFLYKFLVLDLPLLPTNPEGVWQVELKITTRGEQKGKVNAALPYSNSNQLIFDETSSSDRLNLSIRQEGPSRVGVWSGRMSGIHDIAYAFRVKLNPKEYTLPDAPHALKIPKEIASKYLASTSEFPHARADIQEVIRTLALPDTEDPSGRLRSLYAFIDHQIATVNAGAADAVLTLSEREGRILGKSRLFVTLLRAANLPARIAQGLELVEDKSPSRALWVEVWFDHHWIPVSLSGRFFAETPTNLLTLRYDSGNLVSTHGTEAFDFRYTALKERLGPRELSTMAIPEHPVFARLSLYRLPLPAQQALRILLLLPLGALIIALFRNLIGLPTYGTFMPILIGLALRGTPLHVGLLMIAAVLSLGIIARSLLDRLRLLVVPRLSIVLCFVIMAVMAIALIGDGFGNRDFFAGVVFPMVILTMLIERFSITLAEEGLRSAMKKALHTTAVAVAVYPVLRSTTAAHIMFGFPELVIVIMGLLVLIGGYIGYRLTDVLRFRVLSQMPPLEQIQAIPQNTAVNTDSASHDVP